MTRLKTALIIGAVVIGVTAIGYGVYVAAHFYLGEEPHQANAQVECGDKKGATHTIIIQHDAMAPSELAVHHCDTLTLVNQDDKQRRLAFGEHAHHQSYDGVDGKLIGKGEQISLTLTEEGEFMVHDHLQESVHAHFTVSE